MDLRDRLRRAALSRPGVMLVALPGAARVRLALEAELRRRGWPRAEGPAAADLLVVAGERDPLGEDSWLDEIWRGVPKPAVRLAVRHPGDTAAALDTGHRLLREDVRTRHDLAPAVPTPGAGGSPGRDEAAGEEGPGERPEDGAGDDHGGHRAGTGDEGHHGGHDGDHGDSAGPGGEQEGGHGGDGEHGGHGGDGDEHGGHGGGHGDHSSHEMSGPGGLPMADRAQDRDGLTLDRLHLPLGPVLPDWPAGLILRVALQGDVVQRAETDHVPVRRPEADPFWDEPWLRAARGESVPRSAAARRRCAAHLDSLGRFLAVAGWDDPAGRARRLRDGALATGPGDRLREDIVSLARRVARSRALRLLTTGLGPLPAAEARAAGVSGPARTAGGDAYDRLLVWLDELGRAAGEFGDERPLARDDRTGPRGTLDGAAPPSQGLLDVLPGLLSGAEFAGARIVVASLDPDLDELTAVDRREAAGV
ncbi:hypothetical protein KBZ10_18310 [Streptomyces sp. F63]|uniref:hypothetical protein n=1 Tax=Streptomyces sp. F63 TaxID=2824887 RepID=UPI001B390D7E|nr:hypothetical protein [Streptomyces sp. F63]MBQ0986430.1 hypothetical protein [Streptomyces sp. F63]